MKTIYSSTDNFRIQLLKGHLAAAGIESYVLDENISNILPYSTAIYSLQMKLVVDDQDAEQAIEIVKASTNEQLITKCPMCGSQNIELGINGPQKYKKIFAYIIAVFTMSPLGNLQWNYYCKDCKQDF